MSVFGFPSLFDKPLLIGFAMCERVKSVSVLISSTDNQVVGIFKDLVSATHQAELLVKYASNNSSEFVWKLNTLCKVERDADPGIDFPKVFRIESHKVN